MFADQYAEEQDAEIEELNHHQKRLTYYLQISDRTEPLLKVMLKQTKSLICNNYSSTSF
jgi:uncharacterized protein YcgL (UPF0745 family)